MTNDAIPIDSTANCDHHRHVVVTGERHPCGAVDSRTVGWRCCHCNAVGVYGDQRPPPPEYPLPPERDYPPARHWSNPAPHERQRAPVWLTGLLAALMVLGLVFVTLVVVGFVQRG